MCGIAGVVRPLSPDAPAARRPAGGSMARLAQVMSDAQSHRGPDGHGLWESKDQEVAFGHRRLAIIDLSPGGAQPMIDDETGCVLTFNGEIYNYKDLRRDLEAQGATFRSSSDTEVILKAYGRWGIDAVSRFRGIFALALWDPRQRRVHLVRDQMGIKPLYWTLVKDADSGEELLLFASEIRALLASGIVPRALDPRAVASFLWHGFVIGPGTILEGVHLLPAATIMTVDPGGDGRPNLRETRRFWQIPARSGVDTGVERLRAELASTVGMQLVADVPLGVFLSGGVDSSVVAALASQVAPGAVHTFTIGFDVPAYDESRYAQQVADGIKSHHSSVVLTEKDFSDDLEGALASIDQPTFDGINTYFVSRAARNAGMTVALAGTGGDELFGGYASYVDVPRMSRFGAFVPGGNGGGPLGALAGLGGRLTNRLSWNVLKVAPPQTRWGKWADVLGAIHDPLGLYQVSYALFTQQTQATLATGLVRAAQDQQDHGLPRDVAAAWRSHIAGSEPLHGVSVLELSSFIGERLLRDTDAASMAVALEVRVPLLDHALIEAVATIDPGLRFLPSRKKQLLREIGLRGLDPAIFDRPKSGFVLPIDTWARRRLQPRMESLFADPAAAQRVGLDPDVVGTLWRSFVEGRPGLYWSRVWALYVLMSWCQIHEVSLRQ